MSFFNDIAKENISDEKKPAVKEKKEKESSGDYIESCIGKNERPDDEAIDKDLLLGFGSGLN
ncbi:MAG: hypothetical protein JRI28_06435, partial [Deltaproteobacteria bacterium]|nr:hypothetical protein [Deltaproteobacteria bacterium]